MVNCFGKKGLGVAGGNSFFFFDGGDNLVGRQIRRPVKRQFQPDAADEAIGEMGVRSGSERQAMLSRETFGFLVAGKH